MGLSKQSRLAVVLAVAGKYQRANRNGKAICWIAW